MRRLLILLAISGLAIVSVAVPSASDRQEVEPAPVPETDLPAFFSAARVLLGERYGVLGTCREGTGRSWSAWLIPKVLTKSHLEPSRHNVCPFN